MNCSKMRSEAIERLSVGKGAPDLSGLFSFSKNRDSISRMFPFEDTITTATQLWNLEKKNFLKG